jgi:hypothetical protein
MSSFKQNKWNSCVSYLDEKGIKYVEKSAGILLITLENKEYYYYPSSGLWRLKGNGVNHSSEDIKHFLYRVGFISASEVNSKVVEAEEYLKSKNISYEVSGGDYFNLEIGSNRYWINLSTNKWGNVEKEAIYGCYGMKDLLERFLLNSRRS